MAPSADLWALLAIAARPPAEASRPVFDALGLSVPAAFEAWQAAYTEAFVVQCVPQASIYLGAHGAIGGETADRVADFRRLLGSTTQPADTACDHVAELLADYAELTALSAADAQAAHARTALFWEHLACWLMPLCDALQRSAPAPYAGWARLVKMGCLAEAQALGAPAQPALHLRRVPAWSIGHDAADIDAAVGALCVPAATGLVLSRADLAAAGQTLGIALVCGSRVFMLTLLMRQDARAALNWLAGEAGRQADARRVEALALGHAATFWAQRAEASEDALAAMADTARPYVDGRVTA
ncbi:molecular chaperone TorD family protein [Salinisphaera aquimarina]|uniref:Molecular chaperone TorD family protein n=1 Tax=Salinisphaera aquimarina TaxID=2094031 RepID=A0ABV7ERV8_9GAMM